MAYTYLYIGSHGCWSNDGTRYISKGQYADKLEDFPSGYHHRFAVVEKPKVDEFARKPETEVAED